MKNCLVIGNSHAGAIRMGAIKLGDTLDEKRVKFHFVAVGSRFNGFDSIAIEGQRLILPELSEDVTSQIFFYVDIASNDLTFYDWIILASGPNPLNIELYNACLGTPHSDALVRGIATNMNRYERVVREVCECMPSTSVVLGAPPPSSSRPHSPLKSLNCDKTYLDTLAGQVYAACAETHSRKGPKFFLPPPAVLEDHRFETRPEFMFNGANKNAPPDYFHANRDYGKQMIAAFLNSDLFAHPTAA